MRISGSFCFKWVKGHIWSRKCWTLPRWLNGGIVQMCWLQNRNNFFAVKVQLLQLSTALFAFCRTLWTWVSELAVVKIEMSSAHIVVLTSTMLVEFAWWCLPTLLCSLLLFSSLVGSVLCFPDISDSLFKPSMYRTNKSGARTEPSASPWWILRLRLILPLKRTCACPQHVPVV